MNLMYKVFFEIRLFKIHTLCMITYDCVWFENKSQKAEKSLTNHFQHLKVIFLYHYQLKLLSVVLCWYQIGIKMNISRGCYIHLNNN